jgi:hypothetical protein
MLLSFHIMFNLLTRYIININAFDNCFLLFHTDQSFLYGNDLLNIEVRTLMVFLFFLLRFISVLYYQKIHNESERFLKTNSQFQNADTREK